MKNLKSKNVVEKDKMYLRKKENNAMNNLNLKKLIEKDYTYLKESELFELLKNENEEVISELKKWIDEGIIVSCTMPAVNERDCNGIQYYGFTRGVGEKYLLDKGVDKDVVAEMDFYGNVEELVETIEEERDWIKLTNLFSEQYAIENKKNMKPREIKAKLDNYVYGQEEAKKRAAMILWNRIRNIKRNAVFIGPTGCGKTEIWRSAKAIYENIYIYDASSITGDGWKGNKKYYTVFSEMLSQGYSKEDIEHSIIVFDEFDKLCAPQSNGNGENINAAVQGEMLAMFEGGIIPLKVNTPTGPISMNIDTSNISFICVGAFEDLYKTKYAKKKNIGFGKEVTYTDSSIITIQDLIDYGMRAEIAGRMTSVVTLRALNEDDYMAIMCSQNGPIQKLQEIYHVSIIMSKEYAKKIAKNAVQQKLGVRWMNGILEQKINDMIYEDQVDQDSVIIFEI